MLVTLREREDGSVVADSFLRSSDLGDAGENAEWKTVVYDAARGEAVVPNGSIGYRWGEEGAGRWNLDLEDVDPALTLLGVADELVEVTLPRFEGGETEGGTTMRRGVPAKRIGGQLVTTVFDLALAQYGVAREGLPGEWPSGYDDDSAPYTPAWQEAITGVDRGRCATDRPRVRGQRRAHRGSLDDRHGRRDEPLVPLRPDLPVDARAGPLLRLPGRQRRWLGPLRRPGEGPPDHRLVDGRLRARLVATPAPAAGDSVLVPGLRPVALRDLRRRRVHLAGRQRLARRPPHRRLPRARRPARLAAFLSELQPQPARPLRRGTRARASSPAEHVVSELREGRLRFACEDPDDPANFPRVLSLWRANLLGSSSKGHEYFLRHILGVPDAAVRSSESSPEQRPDEVEWHDEAPIGKLDLFTTLDFRMNGSCIYSDVVLPAATWYEKHDLSSTDLHPFVHPFNAAIPPPWETKTDWDAFNRIAAEFSELATEHLGTPHRPRRGAAAPRHARGARPADGAASVTGRRASASRSPARRCRS